MHADQELDRSPCRSGIAVPNQPGRIWRRSVCTGFLFAASITCLAQDRHPSAGHPIAGQPTAEQAGQVKAVTQAQANAATDAKPQADSPAIQTKEQRSAAADSERKKQIADESTRLLTMALALKAEVDKTTKDTLSMNVIRKADEIEKLARDVKGKMKQSAGPSSGPG